MARIFAITVTNDVLKPDASGRGAVSFAVTNTTARPIRGTLKPKPLESTQEAWLTIAGDRERDFSANGTHQVTVSATVPAGTPSGKYSFRLDVLSATNPNEDFTEGPTVAFEVKTSDDIPPPPPWWRRWLIAAVVALVVLAGGGAALYFLLPSRMFVVPNVVGRSDADAEKALSDAGLAVKKTTEATPDVAPGIVKDQNPKPPEEVKRGDTVVLKVATAPTVTKIPVPLVKGFQLLPALQALQQKGLNTIGVNQLRTTDASLINKVLFVSPEAGTPVEPGTPINLTVGVSTVRPWGVVLTPAQKASPFLNRPGVTLKAPQ